MTPDQFAVLSPEQRAALTLDDLSDDAVAHLDELGLIPEDELERQTHRRISPQDLALIDGIAYGLAKFLSTPINQLVADASQERARMGGSAPIVGSRAGAWANQATDYALNTDATYVATAYMKAPPERIYDSRARWVVYAMASRKDLQAWYDSVASTSLYHYVAAFDKTSPEWASGHPVASSAEPTAYTSGDAGQKLDRGARASRSFAQRSKEHDMNGNYIGAGGDPYEGLTDLDAQRGAEYWLPYHQQYLAESKEDPVAFWHRNRAGSIKMYQDQLTQFSTATSPLNRNAALWGMRVAMEQIKLSDRELDKLQFASSHVGGDYVGADGQSYPEIAARAVQGVHQQSASPVYGYFRAGTQQKIYLFGAIDDAQGWLTSLTHGQAQPYDYAAVFAATDLSRPVAGLESFGHTTVSGDTTVGQIWPFLLGLPLGGLAGYFLRRWQEDNPGHTLPFVPPGKLPAPHLPGQPPSGGPSSGPPAKTAGEYATVGGPWLDMEPVYSIAVVGCHHGDEGYTIGGPWLDVVGAQIDDRARASWPQTKSLIHSAVKEVADAAVAMPNATAYVWSLDPPSSVAPAGVTLEGSTGILSFNSTDEALDYMRSRIQTPHVALALFDRTSSHWPNPTNWTKSNDPSYAPIIAQQAAKYAPSHVAGASVGATAIGAAFDDVRARAQSLATKRAGRVIGVIHTSQDNLWHALAFNQVDDADDWLGTATHDPAAYTYAAYYDKDDYSWPHPVNEKIGGTGPRSQPGALIRRGAAVAGHWGA